MVKHASLFSQIISIFNRGQFYQLVLKYEAEKHSKGFGCWDQFVAMLFCQLAQDKKPEK